jgi:hypothetical protein
VPAEDPFNAVGGVVLPSPQNLPDAPTWGFLLIPPTPAETIAQATAPASFQIRRWASPSEGGLAIRRYNPGHHDREGP